MATDTDNAIKCKCCPATKQSHIIRLWVFLFINHLLLFFIIPSTTNQRKHFHSILMQSAAIETCTLADKESINNDWHQIRQVFTTAATTPCLYMGHKSHHLKPVVLRWQLLNIRYTPHQIRQCIHTNTRTHRGALWHLVT